MNFYICESFVEELKKVTEQYGDVNITPYKAKCKYQHLKEPFENIQTTDEKSYILGGCSLDQSNLTPNLQLQKEESCFYMFAPKTLVKHYMVEGAYIITPGWLHQWKSYVQNFWGFDKNTATSFFNEFCKKLVLLDTLGESTILEELKEFSSFVDKPYEIVPIGLEYFNLYVQNIVKEDIAKSGSEKNKKKLNDALQNMSNYAVAFDFLSKLNEKFDEKTIVNKIIEIFDMLFAPENVTYFMIKDSNIVDTISLKSSPNDKLTKFLNMEDNYVLEEGGFAVKLSYANETVGIVSVEKIAFIQYIEKYLNLAISISEVCALAVENARNYLITKEIEAQLAQHAKLVSMGEMMGSIAHQWRQPLNQLNINIEMLEDYYEAGKVDAEFIKKFISRNTYTIHFLSKTISDFSNFFRINKQKTHFSIKEAIEGVLNIMGTQLEKNNIVCEIVGQDMKPLGLPSEFQQVILNIINNAKDAILEANKNGNNGKITIKLEKKDSNALIVITDNGGGIPQAVIDRIFEPYFTTKEQGKGIGMGLYISKMIIEENFGGKLSVANSDAGAVFEIKLELENE